MGSDRPSSSDHSRTIPGAGLDLQDAAVVAGVLDRAAEANLAEPTRRGSTAHLPAGLNLLMTGDLHDHGLNLQRILKLAALHRGPRHHVVLHEIIHGPNLVNGRDLSIRTLARVAHLKVRHPEQVHLLQANHELAQYGRRGISKEGVDVVAAFEDGVHFIYADDAEAVLAAMRRFIASLLLAVRCPNGVLCSHSVPSPRKLEQFDPSVIDRTPTDEDLAPQGSAYLMVWGRNHTPELADRLARAWDAKLFVMGHQPAEMGYQIETRSMLVLASDHSHGVALPIHTSRAYDLDRLIESMVPLASVAV